MTFMMIMSLAVLAWAHPKFMPVNPSQTNFNETRADSLHGFDVTFYDIKGNLMMKKQISGESNLEINFPSGFYFIKIEDAKKQLVELKKIIVL